MTTTIRLIYIFHPQLLRNSGIVLPQKSVICNEQNYWVENKLS